MAVLAVSHRSVDNASTTLSGASSTGHIWCPPRMRTTRVVKRGGTQPTNPDVKIASFTLRHM
eukprot:3510299-Alexandrium_andersonii.AAC.1